VFAGLLCRGGMCLHPLITSRATSRSASTSRVISYLFDDSVNVWIQCFSYSNPVAVNIPVGEFPAHVHCNRKESHYHEERNEGKAQPPIPD
jgi:hypothetical protein